MLKSAKFIELDAGVRYWEDATLNGQEDTQGVMPFRDGDRWRPIIELENGRVLYWPKGLIAGIHYKVCDDGEYWLLDVDQNRIAKWKGFYVPNSILCVGDNGFGDYIIFQINEQGLICDWRQPQLDADQWEGC